MKVQDRNYILKHYPQKSIPQLALELKIGKKQIERLLRKTSARRDQGRACDHPEEIPSQPKLKPRHHGFLLSGLILLILAVYGKSLSYPFMNWDDPQWITENPLIRELSAGNITTILTRPYFMNYVPLTLLSYALEYQVFHFDPLGYRVVNLLLHTFNALWVYGIVWLLTRHWPVAFGTAVIFGIHPVQIESVIWIAERKNVLSAFFFLAGFWVYARGSVLPVRKIRFPLTALVLMTAACLAKPSAVIFPLVLILYDRLFGEKRENKMGLYALFFAVALILGGMTVGITHHEGKIAYHGGHFLATFRTMTVVMMKYFELMIWPARQNLIYAFPAYPSFFSPPVALSLLGLSCLGFLTRRLGRRDKPLFFWSAWYWILLLPVMNLIPFPSLMNDRYLYLPLLGFFTLLFSASLRRLKTPGTILLLCLLTAAYGFLNLKRQSVWSEPEKMWQETRQKVNGAAAMPFRNLGMHYMRQGRLDLAIREFKKGLALGEDPFIDSALGTAYFLKKDFNNALRYYQKAADLKPDEASFHHNLGLVYKEQGNLDSAEEKIKEAIRIGPPNPQFHNNLATVYSLLRNPDGVRRELFKALEIDPHHADSLHNLGMVLYQGGQPEEAEKYWSLFLKLYPQHARAAQIRDLIKKTD